MYARHSLVSQHERKGTTILIIEGSDLTGKTTLCKRLLESDVLRDWGYVYRHLSRLPDRFHRYWGYRTHAHRDTVQDRYHMSEPVYAAVRGDDTSLHPEVYRMVDGYLRTLGAMTVVITVDDAVIKSRWRDGEMYAVDKVLKVNDMFWDIAMKHKFFVDSSHAYDMDVDVHLHVKGDETICDDTVRRLIDAYVSRQDVVRRLMVDRP